MTLAWFKSNLDYLAFCGFWALFFFALHWFRIRKSGFKRSGIAEAAICFSILIAGWFFVQSEEDAERRRIQSSIGNQAQIYAKELERMGHSKINENTAPDDPSYLAMIEAEKRWLKFNPRIADIFTVRKSPHRVVRFIVDSENESRSDGSAASYPQARSPIGKIDSEADPSIDVVLGEPPFSSQVVLGQSGEWNTSFVPMLDESGKVEAALGVSYSTRLWAPEMKSSRLVAMALIGAAELVIALFGSMVALLRSQFSERQRAQMALRESESRFQLHIHQSPLGIIEWNTRGEVIQWNPAAERILGFPKHEVLGEIIFPKILPATELPEFTKNWKALLASQGEERKTFENLTKDGRTLTCEWFNTPLIDKEGKVVGLASMFEDVTEQQRALREIEELAAFPRLNPNPVLQFSADGNLEYFNSAAEEMVKSLGKENVESILPDEIAQIIRECIATGNDKIKRETVLNQRTILWSFFPIAAVRCVHCYAVDVTERVNLEAQLRQSQKMQSVGQLAAGIAHDFNNLLTVILGHGELIRLGEQFTEQGQESLEQIILAAERAAKLTQQLLTFGRKQFMQVELIDLNELIRRVTQMLSRVLGENVALRTNLTPRLPSIEADSTMMEQIVMNLSVNARDAMPQGGSLIIGTNPVLVTRAYVANNPEAREGHFVSLSVSDNGTGIEPDKLNQLFEPFFTTKEVGKGTGLGLATVYGIVKQHKGWIEVESQVGRGTTFRVYLPCAKKQATAETSTGPAQKSRGGKETILLVEDEEGVLTLARSILQSYGYKVLEAKSGVEALRVWETHDGIDLLFTDIVMPEGISGIELAKKLRLEKRDLKVIYSSGYSVEVAGQDFGLREGMAFLKKPYQPKDLARIVRETLDAK